MCSNDAFSAELLPHRAVLLATARRFGEDPEELVQETYLRAFAARHSYLPGSNARAWLCRILVNLALGEKRRRGRVLRFEARLAAVSKRVSEPMPCVRDLERAMSQLSPSDRQMVLLADVEGLRYDELAVRLSCKLGTVMSRLFRARRRLRAAVEPWSTGDVSVPPSSGARRSLPPRAGARPAVVFGARAQASGRSMISSMQRPAGTSSSRTRPRASEVPCLTRPSGRRSR
jgi:RNA polymerase sigma-70 factor (ECF subfamily)